MATDAAALRVTALDVARAAGVSRSAVSQILNGNVERFPVETREKVMGAAAALNYRPSRAGRALVTGLSDLIVVTLPNITFGHKMQEVIEKTAARSEALGMSVVVRYAGIDPSATLNAILDLRPAVVLDFGVFDTAVRRAIIAAGIRVYPSADIPPGSTALHDTQIGRLQARELLRVPDRRLVYALLADSRPEPYGPARARGAALEAAARGAPAPTVVRVPLEVRGAQEALAPVLAPIHDTGSSVGVCCYNDEVAIAVLAAARELRLRVPQDVAVVGVDHTEVGQLVSPRLTTVDIDLPAVVGLIVSELDHLRQHSGHEPRPAPAPEPDTYVSLVMGESS
jgi:DNA-binding LacI/PurR family transcriptional regulator